MFWLSQTFYQKLLFLLIFQNELLLFNNFNDF